MTLFCFDLVTIDHPLRSSTYMSQNMFRVMLPWLSDVASCCPVVVLISKLLVSWLYMTIMPHIAAHLVWMLVYYCTVGLTTCGKLLPTLFYQTNWIQVGKLVPSSFCVANYSTVGSKPVSCCQFGFMLASCCPVGFLLTSCQVGAQLVLYWQIAVQLNIQWQVAA